MADVKGFDEILATPGISEDTRAIVYGLRALAVNQNLIMFNQLNIMHGISLIASSNAAGLIKCDDAVFEGHSDFAIKYTQMVASMIERHAKEDKDLIAKTSEDKPE